jgi:hypothetical protein
LSLLPHQQQHRQNDNDVSSNFARHAFAEAQVTPPQRGLSFARNHDAQSLSQRIDKYNYFLETIVADITNIISTSLARHTAAHVLEVLTTAVILCHGTTAAQWQQCK